MSDPGSSPHPGWPDGTTAVNGILFINEAGIGLAAGATAWPADPGEPIIEVTAPTSSELLRVGPGMTAGNGERRADIHSMLPTLLEHAGTLVPWPAHTHLLPAFLPCRVYWGSHGCDLPRGHDETCICECALGDPDDPCNCDDDQCCPTSCTGASRCPHNVGAAPYYGPETRFWGEDAEGRGLPTMSS